MPTFTAPPPPKSAYEHLYEPTEVGISWDSIEGSENDSWEVTRHLTAEDTEESDSIETDNLVNKSENVNFDFQIGVGSSDAHSEEKELTPAARAYLICAVERDRSEALSALSRAGVSESAVVEEINEAFLLRYGDVFFENMGDTYRPLLEDYETEVTEWIREMNV